MIKIYPDNCKECLVGVLEPIGFTDLDGKLHFDSSGITEMIKDESKAKFVVQVCSRCGNTKMVASNAVMQIFKNTKDQKYREEFSTKVR